MSKDELDACFRHVDARDRVERLLAEKDKQLRTAKDEVSRWRQLYETERADAAGMAAELRDMREDVHSLKQRLVNAESAARRADVATISVLSELDKVKCPTIDIGNLDWDLLKLGESKAKKLVPELDEEFRENCVMSALKHGSACLAGWIAGLSRDGLRLLIHLSVSELGMYRAMCNDKSVFQFVVTGGTPVLVTKELLDDPGQPHSFRGTAKRLIDGSAVVVHANNGVCMKEELDVGAEPKGQ